MKKRLQQYREINLELKSLHERILSLRDRTSSIKSSSDVEGVGGGSGNADKIGSIIADITDLENMYYEKIGKLITEQKEIENMIDGLEPIKRLLIRARYIEGQEWEEVCVVIGYSWRQTHRLHSKILDDLSKMAHNGTPTCDNMLI